MSNGLPELVGTAEAAEILGVEVPRITRWRKHGKMPQPAAELAATTVWSKDDVCRMKDGVSLEELDGSAQRVDVVGTSEAAKMLRVDKSQIGRWRRAGRFPEPCYQLAAGPLWLRSDIKQFVPPGKRPR